MHAFDLPYGNSNIHFKFDFNGTVDCFIPEIQTPTNRAEFLIESAIQNPLAGFGLINNGNNKSVVITINDKTRPVPNNLLLPPLLLELQKNGYQKDQITIMIATGTHTPMQESEFKQLLDATIVNSYTVISHNCDDERNLSFKGFTSRNTPVFVNSIFNQADVKIVVGDIEPHHFAGFSGGVKSASIGVCGRKTINHNHSFLIDPKSCVGRYEDNPLRQDIEEIGEMIGVDLALNAVLNEKKEVLNVFFGKPKDVMHAGIRVVRKNQMTLIHQPYDLVIASAGGFPKDINLYQAQKGLTQASLFCRDGGMVYLAVECREGVGSQSYYDFMAEIDSLSSVRDEFMNKEFKVGPHKAFQFASIAERIEFKIKSEIDSDTMRHLKLESVYEIEKEIQVRINSDPLINRIAVIPYAMATIPIIGV